MLAAKLGIDLADVIAVGDAENDLDVLSVCGLGVAMANACEDARAIADEIVADNNHDGVAELIWRHFG